MVPDDEKPVQQKLHFGDLRYPDERCTRVCVGRIDARPEDSPNEGAALGNSKNVASTKAHERIAGAGGEDHGSRLGIGRTAGACVIHTRPTVGSSIRSQSLQHRLERLALERFLRLSHSPLICLRILV